MSGRRRCAIAVVGLGYWGPNLVRNLHELDRGRGRCRLRRATGGARDDRATVPGGRAATELRRRARTTTTSTRSRSRRRSPLTTSSPRARCEAGKHVFVEKPLAASLDEAIELIELARTRELVADAGPHVPLQPAGERDPRADPRGELGDDLLHLDEPRQPRPASVRRQRHLGPRAARLLDPALLARGVADTRLGAQPRAASSRTRPTSRSSTWSSHRGRSPMSSSPGSRPASSAERRSSARRRWSSTTTRAASRFASSTPASMLRDPETFGEYKLTYRTGDIVSPQHRRRRAARARAGRLLHGDQDWGRPRSSAEIGAEVVRSSKRSTGPSRCTGRWFRSATGDARRDRLAQPARRECSYVRRSARAGTPATVSPGATSRVTTAPAPTSAPSPMVDAAEDDAPEPSDARASHDASAAASSRPRACSAPVAVRGARALVVDEHHAVADEHLVLDLDALADERVALDLAARADAGAALDLDERPDPRLVADPAAVEVGEGVDDDVVAELDVVDQPVGRVVGRPVSHRVKYAATAEARPRAAPR